MTQEATFLQLLGSGAFGAIIGWFLYFTNRYRKEVQLTDVATLVTALGGAAILTLFPAETDLFAAYGIGLFCGFFGYLIVLVVLVRRSPNFNSEWFLDGRRRVLPADYEIPAGAQQTAHAMNEQGDVIQS
jgi:hypothetical protein